MKEIQNFFNSHGYAVIRNVLDPEIAGLVYQYCITKVRRADYLLENYPENYIKKWDGGFGDLQIPNTYYCYGDPLMETLLANILPKMEEYVGDELVPTYSFWRFYQKGDKLLKHKDRESCEISTTLCLGYNVSNVDVNTYPNYAWPMHVEDTQGTVMPVSLYPGDMIIYKGCELFHWREPYLGFNHAQVFLHYNRKNSENNNKYDGREFLGLPQVGGI
jgi:hypothetical protein